MSFQYVTRSKQTSPLPAGERLGSRLRDPGEGGPACGAIGPPSPGMCAQGAHSDLSPSGEVKSGCVDRKRVVFLTYQRTTFTDALRTATSLRQHGAYEPVFLVCAGKRSLVEPQMEECARRGIHCLTEEAALAQSRRGRWGLLAACSNGASGGSKGARDNGGHR